MHIEKSYKVYKMVQVDCNCKECKVPVVKTPYARYINGTWNYKHKCPKCKKYIWLMNEYPHIEHPHMVENETLKKLKIKI